MRGRHLLSAITLGLGLTVALFFFLTHPIAIVRADPGTYYVRQGGTSATCILPSDPCGSIQQAIDLATLPGDEVWVATGTYVENLSISHGVRLRGGWDDSFTTQDPETYATTVDGGDNHVVTVMATTGAVWIEGLVIQNGRDGMHLYAGTITVTQVTVCGAVRQGIEIENGHILLEDNLITEIEREGIEIDGGTVTVRANHVLTTGRHGILVEGGTTIIADNVVRSIPQDAADDYHGIEVTGNHVISGNRVSDVDDRGIYATGGTYTIVSNTVHDTGGDGIRTAASSTHAEIRDNTVHGTGNDGIDARGAVVIVDGNHVSDVADRGINAEDGALTITDNTVHDASGDGVRTAGSGTQVQIQGNAIYTSGNDGVDARGDAITVADNTVQNCPDNGIRAEGDERTLVTANRLLGNGVGLAIRGAPLFTVANNAIGGSITASVELTGTGTGLVAHNTLAGDDRSAGAVGISVPDPLAVTLANNVVVSHGVGINITAGAAATVSHTLLWGNSSDPVHGAAVIEAPPEFIGPAAHDYHLLPGSPAIDAGTDAGVLHDLDGDPRPIGPRPDVGADEAGLFVTKWAAPIPVQPGEALTYTVRVANASNVAVTPTINDFLPGHVSPGEPLGWTPGLLPPGKAWTGTVVVTVEPGYVGPLTNVVEVTSEEGVTGAFTHTLAPEIKIAKQADPDPAPPGSLLTYIITLTNSGDFVLHPTVSDTLPKHVTSTGDLAWIVGPMVPGAVWVHTIAVTVEAGYTGPLTNVVTATTAEGVSAAYTETSTVASAIYLPLVLRAYPPPSRLIIPSHWNR